MKGATLQYFSDKVDLDGGYDASLQLGQLRIESITLGEGAIYSSQIGAAACSAVGASLASTR